MDRIKENISFENVYAGLNNGTKFSKARLNILKVCSVISIICILILDIIIIIGTFVYNEFNFGEFILCTFANNGIFGLGVFLSIFHIHRNKKMKEIFYLCLDDFVKLKAKIVPTPYFLSIKKFNNNCITVIFEYDGKKIELQDTYGNYFIGYGEKYLSLCNKNNHILYSPIFEEVFILKD